MTTQIIVSPKGFATFADARAARDDILADSDWTQSDPELSSSDKSAWATYRTNVKNAVTSAMRPEDIEFPEEPNINPVINETTDTSNRLEVPFETPTWGHVNFNSFNTGKTLSIVSGPSLGALSNIDEETGSFLYTPLNSAYGDDHFTYQIGNSNVKTFYIEVTRERSSPVADLVVTTDSTLTVSFDGSLSYPTQSGATITTYTFNFGDGNTSSGPTKIVNHTFSSSGSYTATLTVTDSNSMTNNESVLFTI